VIDELAAIVYQLGNSTWRRWHKNAVGLVGALQVLLAVKHFSGWRRCCVVARQLLCGFLAIQRQNGFDRYRRVYFCPSRA